MKKINITEDLKRIKEIELLEQRLSNMRNHRNDSHEEETYNRLREQVAEMRKGFKQKSKIQKIAQEVEGRARIRLLNVDIFYNDIYKFLKKFDELKIGKSRINMTFIYDQDAEEMPKAYKYQKMDTIIYIEIKAGKVYITDITREASDKYNSNRFQYIRLSEETRNILISNLLSRFFSKYEY